MHLKLLAQKTIESLSCALLALSLIWSQAASSYVKFSNKPIELWDDLFVQSGADKFYTVQSGDNLYNISKVLFGDASFWPKIWSLNSKITNPHLIEKGQVIYFVGGSPYSAPLIGIRRLQPQSYVYGNHFLSPEIPPEDIRKGPLDLPDSLPNLLRASNIKKESEAVKALGVSNRLAREALRVVQVSSELTQSKPVSVGEIKRVFNGAKYAVVGDLVYLTAFSGVGVGDRLMIFKTRKNWLRLNKTKSGKADLVEWLGSVEVVSSAEKGYVAKVVEANTIIQVNTSLALKEFVEVELPSSVDETNMSTTINSSVKVVGAHKIAGAHVVGENQIVYLNSGSAVGIEAGKIYPLYTNFGESGVLKQKNFVPKRIGYIKVASVEDTVATGVAFNLIAEVQSGQTIGL